MGYFNVIWQGDANAMALQSLAHASAPPFVVNIAGPEMLSVREVGRAVRRAARASRVSFDGPGGADDALLSDARQADASVRPPASRRRADDRAGSPTGSLAAATTLGKPTHFEARDGRF